MADEIDTNSRAWIVAVCNQKGGVGKTTTAINLASVFADSSGRVLVVDADPQRSAAEFASAAGESLSFEVLDAANRADTIAGLRDLRGLDTIIVDCAGNLQDTPLLGEVLAVADFAVIPFVPERAAVQPTLNTARVIAAAGLPHKVLINAADPLRGAGPVEDARALLESSGVPYFQSFVRRYVSVPAAQLDGLPLTAYRGDRSWRSALDDARRVQTELLIELGRLSSKAGVS
ncbi:MAG TPA: ParA family protein [Streptosporangiaceae bacterium]|jgi:chromosome partitioning protein|nr:ParA family protein [Streptosporangiaceae bacterium]